MENIINDLSNYLNESLTISKGEFLFKEGEKEDNVYYIEQGGVNIFKNKSILWSADANEFIGISSFFADGSVYRFSAKATEDSVIYRISNSNFNKILSDNSSFSRKIMNILCSRIALTDGRTKTLLQSSSKVRLIEEIIQKAKDSGNTIVDYTLDELSEIVGVSKRLVRNLIAELEKKKLLERRDGRIHVLDLNGLEIISANQRD